MAVPRHDDSTINTVMTIAITTIYQIGLDRRLSIDDDGIWMCALTRIITMSLDASDVIPQQLPSTALSRHVSGCHQGSR